MNEQNIWKLLKNYFKHNSVVHYQVESFNSFYQFGLQEIIDQEPPIEIKLNNNEIYKVSFGHVSVGKPHYIGSDRIERILYPYDARSRNLTYSAPVYADMHVMHIIPDKEPVLETHPKCLLAELPVMLHSSLCHIKNMNETERIAIGECSKDVGGYFIIKGRERVLVSQIRGTYNRIIVLEQKPNEKIAYTAEVRSMSSETNHSILLKALIDNKRQNIRFCLPYIKEPIPAGIVFKALGFLTEAEIYNLINLNEKEIPDCRLSIRSIIRDAFFINTQEEALMYIGNFAINIIEADKKLPLARQIIDGEILPHMCISATPLQKATFLGKMLNNLIRTQLKIREPDDRDNYANKRVEISGILLYELFRLLYKKFSNDFKTKLNARKYRPDAKSTFSRLKKVISSGLLSAFTSGCWGVHTNAYVRTGVSQVLDRMSYISTISHLKRLVIPIGKEGKNKAIRMIHSSQFGLICPAETPEGQTAGINMNSALMTRYSIKMPLYIARDIIEKVDNFISIRKIDINNISNSIIIFLNGLNIGFTNSPKEFVNNIKNLRRKELLNRDVSIAYDFVDKEIRIYCDEGRPMRPLFILKNNEMPIIPPKIKSYSWSSLIKHEIIEYVDASEIEWSVIAMNFNDLKIQNNDFMEIHPVTILGVVACMIPWPDHSQSPRNCYQTNMAKQALGLPMKNYQIRADTKIMILSNPQKPLVYTKIAKILGTNEMPSGLNAIVAIMTHTGFNQEDSIIINKSAVERGLFHATQYKSIEEVEKIPDNYTEETICIPPKNSVENIKIGQPGYFKRKFANYSFLDEKGIVRVNTEVQKGDVLVGKIVLKTNKGIGEELKDVSRIVQDGEEGIIDSVYINKSASGHKIVKIVIRTEKIPVVGDKFASRAAQKGTCGMMFSHEDMPYTSDGVVPDIIINSLCICSRMTINQIIETTCGKVASLSGEDIDCTPFTEKSGNIGEEIANKLQKLGFQKYGYETMYCGMTGEMLKAKIFIGPTYYQRLKHLVNNKIHARSRGAYTMLMRQSTEGRSRDGGLRFGEMENVASISHGASEFINERLFHSADKFSAYICGNPDCGIICASKERCRACNSDIVQNTSIPYATKLLVQELNAMGIKLLIQHDK